MSKVRAYILVTVAAGKSHSVLKGVSTLPGVVSSHIVTGPYDVIVYLEADNSDELTKLVVDKIHNLPGIIRTMTCFVVGI